jgi:pimeloyl-ACP methyl ester carboxylesterase
MMVHGIAANRLNLDLDERHSIARAAQAHGFDVYLLELRGAGHSRPPGGRERSQFEWGFADYATYDLPAAIDRVLAHSRADAIHGFGHSMGGMLLYAFGVSQPAELRSIATIGAPLVEELTLGSRELKLLQLAARLGSSARRVPIRRLFSAGGRFIHLSSKIVDGSLVNASNVEAEILARLARESIDDVPTHLLGEFHAALGGKPDNGPFAYEASLHSIRVPVLAIGGSADRIAPPRSVRAAVSRLRSPDVRYREMGMQHGDAADYGHIDLLVGRHAPKEIYPLVLDFWDEVDSGLSAL